MNLTRSPSFAAALCLALLPGCAPRAPLAMSPEPSKRPDPPRGFSIPQLDLANETARQIGRAHV